ncbi:MAG: response regulator transcription factor [Pseudonocardiales bacterium]|nr:response regulator transcription factor [Pseudonocardiales bacterium]
MPVLLLVEDDRAVAAAIVRALRDRGHQVRAVGTALDALREISSEDVELVILDLGLPDLDGVDTLRLIRGVSKVPVVVATARSDEGNVVKLLDAGADDYLIKPFSSEHLTARINALLRRSRSQYPSSVGDSITVGALRVDLTQREAFLGADRLALTRREFDLLAYLATHVGRVVHRSELSQEVWHQPPGSCEQSIDVHLSWLRRKLGESGSDPQFVHTVRGVGVKLMEPVCDGSSAG